MCPHSENDFGFDSNFDKIYDFRMHFDAAQRAESSKKQGDRMCDR